MTAETTPLEGLLVLNPKIYRDSRGCFFEAYNTETARSLGIDVRFVQDNQSISRKNALRGLHFQRPPHAQSKLIWVSCGKILDVAVDLRPKSKTFGESFLIELSDQNFQQLFIPKGFAHGFLCLSDFATVCYKCDEFYTPESDSGVRYDDRDLKIPWPKVSDSYFISNKDLELPSLKEVEKHLHI